MFTITIAAAGAKIEDVPAPVPVVPVATENQTDAPAIPWVVSLTNMALEGWKATIEKAFLKCLPKDFLLDDREKYWVERVLVPYLNDQGIVAIVVEKEYVLKECSFLIVSLK